MFQLSPSIVSLRHIFFCFHLFCTTLYIQHHCQIVPPTLYVRIDAELFITSTQPPRSDPSRPLTTLKPTSLRDDEITVLTDCQLSYTTSGLEKHDTSTRDNFITYDLRVQPLTTPDRIHQRQRSGKVLAPRSWGRRLKSRKNLIKFVRTKYLTQTPLVIRISINDPT